MLPRPVVTALTILITLAWCANVVVGFLYPERHDPTLNAIFGVVVGGIFALKRNSNGTVHRARAELARWIGGDDHTPHQAPEDADDTAGGKE